MYQLTTGDSILRLADNAYIPNDPDNRDYQAYQDWIVADNAPQAIAPADIIASYIAQLQAHLDSEAQAHGYDDIKSAALRAGYPGPFHTEGVVFAEWMDACWSTALGLLNQYQAGAIEQPTFQQVKDSLPVLDLA